MRNEINVFGGAKEHIVFRWNVLYCCSKQMAYKFICVLLSLSRYKNTQTACWYFVVFQIDTNGKQKCLADEL